MNSPHRWVLLMALAIFSLPAIAQIEDSNKLNILLIVSDDQGVVASPEYSYDPNPPHTPTLSALAKDGVIFENAWATPMCFTTRAALLTGKHGVNNGVVTEGISIRLEDQTIYEFLRDNEESRDYASAFIGKWHVGMDEVDGESFPIAQGVQYYAGIIEGNFGQGDYDSWNLTIDTPDMETTSVTSREYNTSKLTRLAEDWIEAQNTPWFLTLAYNAPHGPFHWPDESLHGMQARTAKQLNNEICSAGRANLSPEDFESCYNAMVEAMDTEVGNLLSKLEDWGQLDNTLIIFSGDNGSSESTVIANGQAKSSLYAGGLHIPLFASGAGVTRQGVREDRLVTITDIYATVGEIAGIDFDGSIHDSLSFSGYLTSDKGIERSYAFSDIDRTHPRNGSITSGWSIRNQTHMLMRLNGEDYLFEINPHNFMYQNVTAQEPQILLELQQAGERIAAGE